MIDIHFIKVGPDSEEGCSCDHHELDVSPVLDLFTLDDHADLLQDFCTKQLGQGATIYEGQVLAGLLSLFVQLEDWALHVNSQSSAQNQEVSHKMSSLKPIISNAMIAEKALREEFKVLIGTEIHQHKVKDPIRYTRAILGKVGTKKTIGRMEEYLRKAKSSKASKRVSVLSCDKEVLHNLESMIDVLRSQARLAKR